MADERVNDAPTTNGPKADAGGSPKAGEDRALTALKRLARPQPKAFDAPPAPLPELSLGSGSATGFVGTLARPGPGDSRSGTKVGDSAGTVSGSAELIQMAREINLPRPASPIAHLEPPRPAAAPGGYRVLAVLMMLLGVVLLGIGGWAAGAVIYMHNVTPMSPREIAYPLLAWNSDLQVTGAYARVSVIMAWAMLACLPVGVLLLAAGFRLRAPRRRTGNQ